MIDYSVRNKKVRTLKRVVSRFGTVERDWEGIVLYATDNGVGQEVWDVFFEMTGAQVKVFPSDVEEVTR